VKAFTFMAGKSSGQFLQEGPSQAQRQAAGHRRHDCKPGVGQYQRHKKP
jgi:hypothetical protein